jgi:hypothetical protein
MVMVDQQPLATVDLGLETVGEVFSHLARANRLVVHFLIDGQPPNLDELPKVKQSPVEGHTVYIETADPRQMAGEAIREAAADLEEADEAKEAAAARLRRNEFSAAMEKLSICLSAWQRAEQALVGTARVLNVNLDTVLAEAGLPAAWLTIFAENLRQLGAALAAKDSVALTDLLAYETNQTTSQWRQAIAAMTRLL